MHKYAYIKIKIVRFMQLYSYLIIWYHYIRKLIARKLKETKQLMVRKVYNQE